MKRILTLIVCACLLTGLFSEAALAAPAWPSAFLIEADGGILMEASTGAVLYEKNSDQPYYPASITKILTALLVLENCSLDEMVTFSHDDVYNVEAGSSSAGIDEGDVLSVRDCLYALLLASANESANALACHVSGSREAFAERMNEKALSLGCTGSHFANPSGLNDENHYTTAHDMAKIMQAAIRNPDFVEISGTRNYKLPPTKRTPEGGYVANHHRMLVKNEPQYYDGAFAGKTGYTTLAGNTLVTSARKNGLTLIAVVLNGHQTHYTDTRALFEFGFHNFQAFRAADYETTYQSLENDMTIGGMSSADYISLELDPDGLVILPKGASFSDTESTLSYDLGADALPGRIARISYTYQGHAVGEAYLCTASPVSPAEAADDPASPAPAAEPAADLPAPASELGSLTAQPAEPSSGLRITPLVLIIGALALVLGAALILWQNARRKEREAAAYRRQRRLERLEDIGYTSSDFDRLLSQKRTSSPSYRPRRRKGFRWKK